jgi:hypothetical protein
MNLEPNQQIPSRRLFKDNTTKIDSPINTIGIIYVLFVIIFPFFTFGGWGSLFFYPINLIILLPISIWIAVRFHKGSVKFSQMIILALNFVLIFFALPDGGDSSPYQGLEIFIGHIKGMDVTMHFLPQPITDVLTMLFPFFIVTFVCLSLYFGTSRHRESKV